jgi:hypothetical protein
MWYALGANALLIVHLGFILFVIFGALLLPRWPRLAWVHVPVVAWGAWVEIANKVCPLTPWEQQLRAAAGEGEYSGGFIEHYLLAVIYPEGLTPGIQIGLGIAVLVINVVLYARWFRLRSRAAESRPIKSRPGPR